MSKLIASAEGGSAATRQLDDPLDQYPATEPFNSQNVSGASGILPSVVVVLPTVACEAASHTDPNKRAALSAMEI